jgi:hypothetical protein
MIAYPKKDKDSFLYFLYIEDMDIFTIRSLWLGVFLTINRQFNLETAVDYFIAYETPPGS